MTIPKDATTKEIESAAGKVWTALHDLDELQLIGYGCKEITKAMIELKRLRLNLEAVKMSNKAVRGI